MPVPAKCKELISALTDNGWSFLVNHGTDTGNNPYISIEAGRPNDTPRGLDEIAVTWHTRNTGTYRLFHCVINLKDTTLTKVMEVVAT